MLSVLFSEVELSRYPLTTCRINTENRHIYSFSQLLAGFSPLRSRSSFQSRSFFLGGSAAFVGPLYQGVCVVGPDLHL